MKQRSTILGLDRRLALGLAGWLVACFLAASPGAVFMPGEWYAALEEAGLESARMDFWSGVDRTLYHDVRGGVAGVARRRLP